MGYLEAVGDVVVVENGDNHVVQKRHHNQHANHVEEPVYSEGVHLRRDGHYGDGGQLAGHQRYGNRNGLHPLATHQILLGGVLPLGEESKVHSNCG